MFVVVLDSDERSNVFALPLCVRVYVQARPSVIQLYTCSAMMFPLGLGSWNANSRQACNRCGPAGDHAAGLERIGPSSMQQFDRVGLLVNCMAIKVARQEHPCMIHTAAEAAWRPSG